MRHRVWLLGLCAILFFGPAACQSTDEGQAGRNPQMTAHRFNRDDGLNGITNANPNMWVGDWYAPTKTDDIRRAKRLIRDIPGVRNATAIIAGGRMLLWIIPEPGVKAERYASLKQEVWNRVKTAFPRYDVSVAIDPRSRFRLPIRTG